MSGKLTRADKAPMIEKKALLGGGFLAMRSAGQILQKFRTKTRVNPAQKCSDVSMVDTLRSGFPGSFFPVLILFTIFIVMGVATAAYLARPFSYRMAAFVTDLQARTPEQRHNILKAAAPLDGLILDPGASFSFNQVAGPYTETRGFLPERSIQGERVIQTSGGGVCQVSSTLYNAAKLAGLEIMERTAHTQEVESVPPGWDATLAYGVSDLKFRNPYTHAIQLRVRLTQNQLLMEVWGKERPQAKLTLAQGE